VAQPWKGPTACLNFHCKPRACCSRGPPTRQQRLDVAKTVKPVGQQGSSLTSNPPSTKHQKPPSVPVSPESIPFPRETESLFFPDIYLSPDATSSSLLSSHALTLYLLPAPPTPSPHSLSLPPCTCTVLESVYEFYPRSHLPPIVERTLRHLYRRLFQSISPSPSLPLVPRPLQLRLRASTLAAMSSSDDDMPLSRTNGHGKSTTMLAMFDSPPCGAVSPVVAPNARRHELTCHNSSPVPPSQHPTAAKTLLNMLGN
jgi:hypothetical protein